MGGGRISQRSAGRSVVLKDIARRDLPSSLGSRFSKRQGPGAQRSLGEVVRTHLKVANLISKISVQPLQESPAGEKSHHRFGGTESPLVSAGTSVTPQQMCP